MAVTSAKHKILYEIDLIPEDKLADLYQVIHYFRLGAEKSIMPRLLTSQAQMIMDFAGSWQDMSDEVFSDFLAEIDQRRQQAFGQRKDDAKIID